ncbi:unnamed protein product [Hyaloperonospora brassicae]|uniref:Uncharacterized protein n=1 Tax=Hyaloperonospora brassicae TaxID=162125 RepID=A0AAV0UC23_HYABA|nr:unnamed protein product [Hyaloperonospora brassicae]
MKRMESERREVVQNKAMFGAELGADNKKIILDKVSETLHWLKADFLAGKEEPDAKQKELEQWKTLYCRRYTLRKQVMR